MNDTTRRFLNAILERVPESRVVEVRLFPAIRQGGVESAVAVLAMEPEPEAILVSSVSTVLDEDTLALATPDDPDTVVTQEMDTIPAEAAGDVEVRVGEPVDEMAFMPSDDGIDVGGPGMGAVTRPAYAGPVDVIGQVFEALERESAVPVVADGVSAGAAPIVAADAEVALHLAPALLHGDAASPDDTESMALGDILALPSPTVAVSEAPEPTPRHRLAILCARYRLVFKGPDRGKWDLEIMHQADAPLDTLDRVISGVVRRAGEESEPERFTRERLRQSLDAPVWAQSA